MTIYSMLTMLPKQHTNHLYRVTSEQYNKTDQANVYQQATEREHQHRWVSFLPTTFLFFAYFAVFSVLNCSLLIDIVLRLYWLRDKENRELTY